MSSLELRCYCGRCAEGRVFMALRPVVRNRAAYAVARDLRAAGWDTWDAWGWICPECIRDLRSPKPPREGCVGTISVNT